MPLAADCIKHKIIWCVLLELRNVFKWKLRPVVLQIESGSRSSSSSSWTIITIVDKNRSNENVYDIIFIVTLFKSVDIVSITTKHLLSFLIVTIPQVNLYLTIHWWKQIYYTKFDIQCIGGHIMMLDILPRTLFHDYLPCQ